MSPSGRAVLHERAEEQGHLQQCVATLIGSRPTELGQV